MTILCLRPEHYNRSDRVLLFVTIKLGGRFVVIFAHQLFSLRKKGKRWMPLGCLTYFACGPCRTKRKWEGCTIVWWFLLGREGNMRRMPLADITRKKEKGKRARDRGWCLLFPLPTTGKRGEAAISSENGEERDVRRNLLSDEERKLKFVGFGY